MRWLKFSGLLILLVAMFGCGKSGGTDPSPYSEDVDNGLILGPQRLSDPEYITGPTIWDTFGPSYADQKVGVNRYLWAASMDVLSFLPIQSVDPFTGVIITGYGIPPGGGRSYRATVHIRDPALDARSLKVSLQTKGGPVSSATARAVEDAILARARQIRIGDNKL